MGLLEKERKKLKIDGKIYKFKARLVAKDFATKGTRRLLWYIISCYWVSSL